MKSNLTHQLEPHQLLDLLQKHEVLIAAKPDPELIQQIFTRNCTSDLMVTNLGRLTLPQSYGSLFLEAVYGPMVLSGFRQERVLGVATLGDRLFFTMIHPACLTETTLVQQAMQLLAMAIVRPNFPLSSTPALLLETCANTSQEIAQNRVETPSIV